MNVKLWMDLQCALQHHTLWPIIQDGSCPKSKKSASVVHKITELYDQLRRAEKASDKMKCSSVSRSWKQGNFLFYEASLPFVAMILW
jgi:hypothetical protein